MATATFTIPNSQLSRISSALDNEGYIFDATLGTTDVQQRRAFFRRLTVEYWQSIVFNNERKIAIAAEPNDTAAEQAIRFVNMGDITSTVV